MNDAQRMRLLLARDAWRDAEKAYSNEAARYAGVWWFAQGSPPDERWPEPVTAAALARLRELREAADTARTDYYDLAATPQS
jgi:hypothetical protein